MKNSAIIFKYQFDIHGRSFPLIPISIRYGKNKMDYFALIDSGATISIFKTDIASKLGINIEKGKEISMRSVTGWIMGYVHNLDIKVGGKLIKCDIVFSNDYQASINILGRSCFFEKFKITFDEKNKSVILQ